MKDYSHETLNSFAKPGLPAEFQILLKNIQEFALSRISKKLQLPGGGGRGGGAGKRTPTRAGNNSLKATSTCIL